MADFQSSKTAQEIETVLTGAVLFNTNTKLTETQKAQARANIGATANGEGIKIISHFDTLAELEATVKTPNAGDAYSVGSSLPYNLYIYDYLYSVWRDYGAIRSEDITARFAQNMVVDVSAWEEDTDVFVDYTYKAAISLGEVSGNDFPIVAFAPSDAVGGNFCPVCYAFDGYVEIWAKTIPTTAISIPAITFIVQSGGANGTNTKGITNASGGVATGGITNEMLAPNSVGTSKMMNGSVTRAKLAQDALYSPMQYVSADRAIGLDDLGKKLICNAGNNALEVTVDSTAWLGMPTGTEIVLIRWMKGDFKLTITGNLTAISDIDGIIKQPGDDPVSITTDIYKTFALQKTSSTGVYITGYTEVV